MPIPQAYIPPHITCVAEAQKALGITPGSTVYLKVTCGDYNAALQKSITLHPGHEGIIDEIYISSDIWWKVRIKIVDPLAQPFLIWSFEDFPNNWTTDPNAFARPERLLSCHERLEIDRLGELMKS